MIQSMPVLQEPLPRVGSSDAAGTTVFLDGHEVHVPASAFTLTGFRSWARSDDFPEQGRISYIGGEVLIDMSGDELETHNLVKLEVASALVALNKKRKFGKLYADGALVSNEVGEVSNQPDASFAFWESIESGRVRFVPREGEEGQFVEIEGSPDWVLEVVSLSSVRKDRVRLREAYFRAGIKEYWLIDARGDEIDFQILWHEQAGYVEAPASRGGWQESRVFRRRFRLLRRRDRVGLWEYTLQVKTVR